MDFTHIKHTFSEAQQCSTGVACLFSILRYWGRWIEPSILTVWSGSRKGKTSMLGLQKAASFAGFMVRGCRMNVEQLRLITAPVILFIKQENEDSNDYVICYGYEKGQFLLGDTTYGLMDYSAEELTEIWIRGITCMLSPNDKIPAHILLSQEKGVSKLGCELIFLFQKGYIDGNEEEALLCIDDAVCYEVLYKSDSPDFDWLGRIRYFRLRIEKEKQTDMLVTEMRNRHHLIYLLDCLERLALKGIIFEKAIVNEVKKIHNLKLCPEKTNRLLTGYWNVPFRTVPLSSNDTTFVIPIRVDSAERERNLDLLLSYLTSITDAYILIIEADKQPKYRLKASYPNVYYHFVKDIDPVFHRTKYLNELLRMAQTAIVGIWDTDVILPKEQIMEAIEAIRSGRAVMSFPFDGRFCMLSATKTDLFLQEQSISILQKEVRGSSMPYGEHSVGGAFLVNKELYLAAGGENEYFYGWGPEDAERVKRMEILNLPIYRSEGCLFHLFHPRKANSFYTNTDLEIRNRKELLKVCSMTKQELHQYIQTWHALLQSDIKKQIEDDSERL